jgi:hypothetical protein
LCLMGIPRGRRPLRSLRGPGLLASPILIATYHGRGLALATCVGERCIFVAFAIRYLFRAAGLLLPHGGVAFGCIRPDSRGETVKTRRLLWFDWRYIFTRCLLAWCNTSFILFNEAMYSKECVRARVVSCWLWRGVRSAEGRGVVRGCTSSWVFCLMRRLVAAPSALADFHSVPDFRALLRAVRPSWVAIFRLATFMITRAMRVCLAAFAMARDIRSSIICCRDSCLCDAFCLSSASATTIALHLAGFIMASDICGRGNLCGRIVPSSRDTGLSFIGR